MPDLPAIRSPRWAPWVTWPLSFIGLGIAIYLTIEHFRGVAPICSATGHIDCVKVTKSPQSEIFGHIPVALTGLVYFVVMIGLLSPWAWRAKSPVIAWLRLAAVVSGMGMVIYLVYAEAVQIKAICLWCTGVHIITFLLFLTVLAAYLLRPLDPIEA